MSLIACMLTLAGMTACEPERPLAAQGGRRVASLANPDSVSVARICGNRLTIKNANDYPITLRYILPPATDSVSVTLPSRSPGEPYSETFLVMTQPGGLMVLRAGDRSLFTQWGPPSCPTRPVVPPLPPATTEQSVLDAGRSYLLADSSYGGKHISFRRFLVRFIPGTSQEVRQAVLDVISATVLGGIPGRGEGDYYIEVPLPLDSGVGPRNVIWARLMRNAAVALATPEIGNDVVVPQGLSPNDSAGWQQWKTDGADISHAGWFLEAGHAPLAWGCSVGDSSVALAIVDEGLVSNADVPVTVSGIAGRSSPPHASFVSSILRATGNNRAGMTGVVWKGTLSFFAKADSVSPTPGFSGKYVTGFGFMHAILRALASGARVVNVSLGLNWTRLPGSAGRFKADSSLVARVADGVVFALSFGFQRLDSLGVPRPLIVLAAGNNGLDAKWSGFPAALASGDSALFKDQVLVVGGLARNATPSLWTGVSLNGTNTGDLVDVLAPAQGVSGLVGSNVVATDSGTSFAAPQVAGAAALALALSPSLTAAQLKDLIVRGSAAGGVALSNPLATAASKLMLPPLHVYGVLRMTARRNAASLCGNRLWASGKTLFAERDSGVGAEIRTLPDTIRSFDSFHGGRQVLATLRDGSQHKLNWTGTTWTDSTISLTESALIADTSVTRLSGSARSRRGYAHEGDTLVHISARFFQRLSFEDSLFVQRAADTTYRTILIPRDTLPDYGPTYVCYVRGVVGYGLKAPNVFGIVVPAFGRRTRDDGTLPDCGRSVNPTLDSRLRPRVARSLDGSTAYVAINGQHTSIDGTGPVVTNCGPPSFITSECNDLYMRQAVTFARLLRVNLATGGITMLDSRPGANITSLALGEDGRELLYTRLTGAVRYTLRYDVPLPLGLPEAQYDFATNSSIVLDGACTAVFRNLTTGLQVTKTAGGQCVAPETETAAGAGGAALRMRVAHGGNSRPTPRARAH